MISPIMTRVRKPQYIPLARQTADSIALGVACRNACPVGTDAEKYILAIGQGRYLDAYRIARANNPFASLCGRICEAPCETSCIRGNMDAPVAIRALKHAVTSAYGPESPQSLEFTLAMSDAPGSSKPQSNGLRVAVIGAGLAGLSCAHDLARLGYSVTVFEKEDIVGGFIASCVPSFRLNQRIFRREIEAIACLGVSIALNNIIEMDSLHSLVNDRFSAVCLATGCEDAGNLPENFIDALALLRKVKALSETSTKHLTKEFAHLERYRDTRCVVLADDLSDAAPYVPDAVALDAARSLIRLGAAEVTVINRFEECDYLASGLFDAARQEGVSLVFGVADMKMHQITGGLSRITVLTPGMALSFPADHLFGSYPQSSVCLSHETGQDNVFVCGSARLGKCMLIESIADGQKAAKAIHKKLMGKEIRPVVVSGLFPVDGKYTVLEASASDLPREEPPSLPAKLRKSTWDCLEFAYAEIDCWKQSARCLQCHISTTFNEALCDACGKCVETCPTHCLALGISPSESDSGPVYSKAHPQLPALLKDDGICTRCGKCAEVCPTQAITMGALETRSEYPGS